MKLIPKSTADKILTYLLKCGQLNYSDLKYLFPSYQSQYKARKSLKDAGYIDEIGKGQNRSIFLTPKGLNALNKLGKEKNRMPKITKNKQLCKKQGTYNYISIINWNFEKQGIKLYNVSELKQKLKAQDNEAHQKILGSKAVAYTFNRKSIFNNGEKFHIYVFYNFGEKNRHLNTTIEKNLFEVLKDELYNIQMRNNPDIKIDKSYFVITKILLVNDNEVLFKMMDYNFKADSYLKRIKSGTKYQAPVDTHFAFSYKHALNKDDGSSGYDRVYVINKSENVQRQLHSIYGNRGIHPEGYVKGHIDLSSYEYMTYFFYMQHMYSKSTFCSSDGKNIVFYKDFQRDFINLVCNKAFSLPSDEQYYTKITYIEA